MLIFTCGIAFIVDIYLAGSASALAANTFVRSISAAGASHPFSISSPKPTYHFRSLPCIPSFPIEALHRTKEPFLSGRRTTNQDSITDVVPQKYTEAQPSLPSIQPNLLPASHLPAFPLAPSLPSLLYTNSSHPFLSETPLTNPLSTVPTLRPNNVPPTRDRMGNQRARLHLHITHTRASGVLSLWG